MELTGVGIWSSQLRYGDPSESAAAAAELDGLGLGGDHSSRGRGEKVTHRVEHRPAHVGYPQRPNYANNLLRSGFSEDDLAQVSDRLFDAIIAWGDEDAILRRIADHRSAGADHVCVQVLLSDPRAFPREQWRRIAATLA
jgi:hypothetical protein